MRRLAVRATTIAVSEISLHANVVGLSGQHALFPSTTAEWRDNSHRLRLLVLQCGHELIRQVQRHC